MKKAENDRERVLLAEVRKYGWHTMGVMGKGDKPAYVFTVGLFHTFKHPELCIVGLKSVESMGHILNDAGEAIREGRRFENGQSSDDLLDNYTCQFRTADPKHYPDYLGYATWFYDGVDFPVLQCVWPDEEKNFPWDDSFNDKLRPLQPLLV